MARVLTYQRALQTQFVLYFSRLSAKAVRAAPACSLPCTLAPLGSHSTALRTSKRRPRPSRVRATAADDFFASNKRPLMGGGGAFRGSRRNPLRPDASQVRQPRDEPVSPGVGYAGPSRREPGAPADERLLKGRNDR